MELGTLIWIITILMCAVFMFITWKVKDSASMSFSNYAIGGKNLPIYLIFFTQFATIMGVGNFVGHAGSGYTTGLPWMAFILGEQGSKIIFALLFAGLAGKFSYNTFPEMLDDLFVRDKVTRGIAGVLAACIMIAWVGGQGKAMGHLFNIITGVDPIPIIILFSAVFIIYTTLGGILSVVWTDLFQGILVVIFGIAFYAYAFSPVNWSLAELGNRLAEVGKAEYWSFTGGGTVSIMSLITSFLTGCVGILVAQIYWQRCFGAKDKKTARNGMLSSGIIAIIMVMLTALVGMVIYTLNQDLAPDQAMPWFMMNYIPTGIAAMIFALILAAGMSSADSNLNSASILIVNDLIRSFKSNVTDDNLIKYAKIITVIIGAFACIAGIYATTIMSLFSRAYQMAGGGLVPLLIVGLLWKERPNEEFKMGTKNSKVTPWGARIGIIVGAVLTQISALGPYRLFIALIVSTVLIIAISIITKDKSIKGKVESA